jgi:hypothetical protein
MLAAIEMGKSMFRNIERRHAKEEVIVPPTSGAARARPLKISRSMKVGHTPNAIHNAQVEISTNSHKRTRKVSLAKAHGEKGTGG